MNNKKFDDTSEEKFLKNKAKRSHSSSNASIKQNSAKSSSRALPIFGAIGGAIAALLAVAAIIILFFVGKNIIWPLFVDKNIDGDNQHNDIFTTIEGTEVGREYITINGESEKRNFTFLATATDKSGALTDVIMIANMINDAEKPSVSILQIPRDTYVKISPNKLYFNDDGTLSEDNFTGSNATLEIKINEVFYRGRNLAESKITKLLEEIDGMSRDSIEQTIAKNEYVFLKADVEKLAKYASSTDKTERNELDKNIRRDFGLHYLEQLIFCYFRIPIDYHAQVNIKGFRGIVDAIGGVDLYVKQDMDYDDPYQDLHIHIKKGQQHLNGTKAEQFVRYRGYSRADLARLDAQKDFINAFLDKLFSFSTVTKIDNILAEIDENLYTTVSFENLVRFANKAFKMDLENGFTIETLPGVGEYIGGISYFVCDRDTAIDLINSKYNVFVSEFADEDFMIIDDSTLTFQVFTSSNITEDEEVEEFDKEAVDDEEAETDEKADDDKINASDDGDIEDKEDTVQDDHVNTSEKSDNNNSDDIQNDEGDLKNSQEAENSSSDTDGSTDEKADMAESDLTENDAIDESDEADQMQDNSYLLENM